MGGAIGLLGYELSFLLSAAAVLVVTACFYGIIKKNLTNK
jgi:hypothetical protein